VLSKLHYRDHKIRIPGSQNYSNGLPQLRLDADKIRSLSSQKYVTGLTKLIERLTTLDFRAHKIILPNSQT
jgi:hypothetical protein